jgi:hypothetical protein
MSTVVKMSEAETID